jgi:hypothetical protein
MRASRPGDTFLASLVVMSRSRWGGVCLSGRGDNGCEAETDASVDVDVGLSGGDFAGSGVGRISLFAADAGLLLLWLKGGAVCSLIEHFWGALGETVAATERTGCLALEARGSARWRREMMMGFSRVRFRRE